MFSKKIISQVVLIILFNFHLIYSQEQLKDWVVPPYYLSGFPNPAIGNLPLSTFSTNATRYFNGVYPTPGTPEFFIVDDVLYSTLVGSFGTDLVALGSPV